MSVPALRIIMIFGKTFYFILFWNDSVGRIVVSDFIIVASDVHTCMCCLHVFICCYFFCSFHFALIYKLLCCCWTIAKIVCKQCLPTGFGIVLTATIPNTCWIHVWMRMCLRLCMHEISTWKTAAASRFRLTHTHTHKHIRIRRCILTAV